jgi:hypothetical protein
LRLFAFMFDFYWIKVRYFLFTKFHSNEKISCCFFFFCSFLILWNYVVLLTGTFCFFFFGIWLIELLLYLVVIVCCIYCCKIIFCQFLVNKCVKAVANLTRKNSSNVSHFWLLLTHQKVDFAWGVLLSGCDTVVVLVVVGSPIEEDLIKITLSSILYNFILFEIFNLLSQWQLLLEWASNTNIFF